MSGDGGSVTTSRWSRPVDTETVGRLQDDAQLALNRYVDASATQRAVSRPFRVGQLLLLVAALRAVSADTIEHLYFRSTLGDVAVARIVADMYASADV